MHSEPDITPILVHGLIALGLSIIIIAVWADIVRVTQ